MASQARSFTAYMLDGTATGPIRCTTANWSGAVYRLPLEQLHTCSERLDLQGTGVYVLTCTSDPNILCVDYARAQPEGKSVVACLKDKMAITPNNHAPWTDALVLVAPFMELLPSDVVYLTNRLGVEMTKQGNRKLVEYEQETVVVAEERVSDLEEFIWQSMPMLNVLMLNQSSVVSQNTQQILEQPEPSEDEAEELRTQNPAEDEAQFEIVGDSTESAGQNRVLPEDIMYYLFDGLVAMAYRQGDNFVLLKGSQVKMGLSSSENTSYIRHLRERHLSSVDSAGIVLKDITFATSSRAAQFASGAIVNGLSAWIEAKDYTPETPSGTAEQNSTTHEPATPQISPIKEVDTEDDATVEQEYELIEPALYLRYRGLLSTAHRSPSGFVVHKGSQVSSVIKPSCSQNIRMLRHELSTQIDSSGVLLSDQLFSSSSTAAGFLTGSSTSGPEDWKTLDGTMLKDLGRPSVQTERQIPPEAQAWVLQSPTPKAPIPTQQKPTSSTNVNLDHVYYLTHKEGIALGAMFGGSFTLIKGSIVVKRLSYDCPSAIRNLRRRHAASIDSHGIVTADIPLGSAHTAAGFVLARIAAGATWTLQEPSPSSPKQQMQRLEPTSGSTSNPNVSIAQRTASSPITPSNAAESYLATLVDVEEGKAGIRAILNTHFQTSFGYSNINNLWNAAKESLWMFINDNGLSSPSDLWKFLEATLGIEYTLMHPHIWQSALGSSTNHDGIIANLAQQFDGLVTRERIDDYFSRIVHGASPTNAIILQRGTFLFYESRTFVLATEVNLTKERCLQVKEALNILFRRENLSYIILRDIAASWYTTLPRLSHHQQWTTLLLQEVLRVHGGTIGYRVVFSGKTGQPLDTLGVAIVPCGMEDITFADIAHACCTDHGLLNRSLPVETLRITLREAGMLSGGELIGNLHKTLNDRRFAFTNGNRTVRILER